MIDFGAKETLVWDGITFGSCTSLHVFDGWTVKEHDTGIRSLKPMCAEPGIHVCGR